MPSLPPQAFARLELACPVADRLGAIGCGEARALVAVRALRDFSRYRRRVMAWLS